MGELRLLSGITAIAMLLSAGLWIGMIVYVVARWRTYREAGANDPQLGLKTALALFLSLSLQLGLLGMFNFFWALFTKGEHGDLLRDAFALLVPAGLVFGAHLVAIKRSNAEELPLVPRMFEGVSLIITGLIGFAALVMAFKILFARGEAGEEGRMALAAVLVYPAAWVLQGMRFVKRVSTGAPPPGVPSPTAEYARAVPPPAVPVPPPAVPPP